MTTPAVSRARAMLSLPHGDSFIVTREDLAALVRDAEALKAIYERAKRAHDEAKNFETSSAERGHYGLAIKSIGEATAYSTIMLAIERAREA